MSSSAAQTIQRRLRSVASIRSPEDVTRLDLLLIGLLIVAVAVFLLDYALGVGSFQNDEQHYMQLARYIPQDFPSALVKIPGYGYIDGIGQRLDIWIMALPFALLRGPGSYQMAHAIQCLLFASAALPVFLLARRGGLGRIAALLAAALTVIVPWSVDATSFLGEPVAYPAFAWVLYLTWRTARRPSWHADLVVLVSLFVADLARTELLALTALPPLAIVWHEWSWELAGVPRLQRSKALVVRMWSAHRLMSVVIVIGLLATLADEVGLLSVASLSGHYGLPALNSLGGALISARYVLARVAVGTGFLSLALALPWALATLVRPRDGGRHAAAVVCTLGAGAILLALAQYAPGADERYDMYLAVPVALGAAWALSDWATTPRLRLGPALGLLLSTLVVLGLIAGVTWPPLMNVYDWFTYPAAMFYGRVVLNHAGDLHVPVAAATTVAYGLVAGVVLVAFVVSRSRFGGRAAAVGMAIVILLICAVETQYTLRKYLGSPAAETTPAAVRSFVDAVVPSSADAGALAVSEGTTNDYFAIWEAVEFWNSSIDRDVYFNFSGPGFLPLPVGSAQVGLSIQPPSGRLLDTTGVPLPQYLVIPQQGTNAVGLVGSVIASSTWVPLEVEQLAQPARAAWSILGEGEDGYLTSGQPATATVYSTALAGAARRCATFSLIAPVAFAGRWPFSVSDGQHRVVSGGLTGSHATQITLPLAVSPGADATFTVKVTGDTPIAGTPMSAELAFFSVAPCSLVHPTVTVSKWPPS